MDDETQYDISMQESSFNPISPAVKRKRNLSLAVITSVISKIANTAVQVLAMPIALHVLGVARFGVYTSLAAAIGWLGLSSIGIGPGLTRKIAEAAAKEDYELEKRLVSSSFFFMLSIILPIVCLSYIFVWLGDPLLIFGQKYLPYLHEIRLGLSGLLFFFFLRMLLTIGEASQMGYQEQYVINSFGAAGNFLCLFSLLFITRYFPTILGIIIAVYGITTFARLCNFLVLIFKTRPYLIPTLKLYNKSLLKGVIGTGIAYSLVQLSLILSYDLNIIVAGRIIGPSASARLGVLIQAVTLGMGMVAMITQPLWPALADAATRKEKKWIANAYHKAMKTIMLYAIAVGLIIGLGGKYLVLFWYGPKVVPSFWLHFFIGIDFLLEVWFHLHFIFLMGLGNIKKVSILIFTKSVVTLPVSVICITYFGLPGAAFSLVITMLLIVTFTVYHEFKLELNKLELKTIE